MRVAIAGTRSFGIAVAQRLAEQRGTRVVAVFSPADDRLSQFAAYHGVHRSSTVTEGDVRALEIDLIVGAHCHTYLTRAVREAATHGAIVGHPSLLPRHRGKSAAEWTVRFRDATAGFSWIHADDGVDTGPIVVQDWCHVDPLWSASDLWRERLFPMGVSLAAEAVSRVYRNVPAVPQDSRFATWEPALDNVPNLDREMVR